MALPTAPGELIKHGLLYRLIPNSPIYWEYDRDRPSPRVFRLRPGERDGVSMYLDGLTSADRLEALEPSFGIYAVQVEHLLTEQRVSVVYMPDGTVPEGVAHVVVRGVNRRVAEWIARQIARRLKPPAAAAATLVSEPEEDRPPDPWQFGPM